uniref:hypothetical protein n=1 Tax=Capnocytophaga sputigena TaxID=1019 RepID=UPI0028EA389A
VFFILQIFSQLFLKVFCSCLKMKEIFFEENLGETRRNSEGGAIRTGRDGVRAARAERGCELHGQGWELWEGWERWWWDLEKERMVMGFGSGIGRLGELTY